MIYKEKEEYALTVENNFTLSTNHNHIFRYVTPPWYDMENWTIFIGCQYKINLYWRCVSIKPIKISPFTCILLDTHIFT
jgi:hypothetical protein